PTILRRSAMRNRTAASGFAIAMWSGCSSACGPATSSSSTPNARRKSRGCSRSLDSCQSVDARRMPSRIGIVNEVKMLSFAAVGSLGREWRTRFACGAVALAILSEHTIAQPSGPFVDVASDLASKIADALAPAAAIRLEFSKEDARIQSEVTRALSARGFRVVDGGEGIPVRGGCGANLR